MTFGRPNSVGGPRGGQKDPLSKIQKSLIQNSGLKPHRTFQHSSLIRKCSKFGRTELTVRRVLGPPRGTGGSDFKNSKNSHTERWSEPTLKISEPELNYKVFKNRGMKKMFKNMRRKKKGERKKKE